MAFSVARMPAAEEWHRGTDRIANSIFGPHIHLKKVRVREPPEPIQPSTSSSSSCRDSNADKPDSPVSDASQRQSQNLDRWAARQAREMVITIERQVHNAKLSELSTTAMQPVAESSSSPFGSSGVTKANEPQNVRASSLIQMWRELEAEAGIVRTPRMVSGLSTFIANAIDDSEASGDSETEVTEVMSSNCSSAADNEKGRVGSILRMLSIKRTTKKNGGASCSSMETNESVSIREVESSDQQEVFGLPSGGLVRLRCRREAEDLMERMLKERQREVVAVGERHPVSQFSHRGRIQSVLKVRFLRRESAVRDQPQPVSKKRKSERLQSGSSILLLRERFDNGRQQNGNGVQTMESLRTINVQFPINSEDSTQSDTIQVDVSNNQYQEVVSTRDQESLPPEINSQRSRSEVASELTSTFTRAEGTAEPSSPDSRVEGMPELNSVHSTNEGVFVLNSPCSRTEDKYGLINEDIPELDSMRSRTEDKYGLINEDIPELDSMRSRSEGTPELNSPRSRNEELQGIQIPDGSWDERSLWVGNLAWQESVDSSTSQGWLGEVATDEVEPYTRQHVTDIGHIWIGSCSPSRRGWGIGEHDYHDFLESFSDNSEIRELLERRMVSTSLASDFCDKMNRMILTVINRQDQQCTNENLSEEYEEQPIWRQNDEFNNANHVASGSSLVPSLFQSVNCPESWQYTSFTQNSSLNPQEPETEHDLKTEMAQMHQEISQLRKLVESCLEWQIKLQQCVKDEVSSAVRQSVVNASDSSKRTLNRKDSCCICYEMRIDSLLYRCGHMCTCFKCAQELQWSSGRCPICRSPIVDVVRAYPNS